MKQFIRQHLWWLTCTVALLLLVAHTLRLATLTVDSTSILLLVVMLVSPFVAAIKKIKFGEFEAEIDPAEVKKSKDETEAALGVSKKTSRKGFRKFGAPRRQSGSSAGRTQFWPSQSLGLSWRRFFEGFLYPRQTAPLPRSKSPWASSFNGSPSRKSSHATLPSHCVRSWTSVTALFMVKTSETQTPGR